VCPWEETLNTRSFFECPCPAIITYVIHRGSIPPAWARRSACPPQRSPPGSPAENNHPQQGRSASSRPPRSSSPCLRAAPTPGSLEAVRGSSPRAPSWQQGPANPIGRLPVHRKSFLHLRSPVYTAAVPSLEEIATKLNMGLIYKASSKTPPPTPRTLLPCTGLAIASCLKRQRSRTKTTRLVSVDIGGTKTAIVLLSTSYDPRSLPDLNFHVASSGSRTGCHAPRIWNHPISLAHRVGNQLEPSRFRTDVQAS
jgi:hypothetical protein